MIFKEMDIQVTGAILMFHLMWSQIVVYTTEVGVCFICEDYIMCLKRHVDSKINLGPISFLDGYGYRPYIAACEDDMNLHDHARKLVDFILYFETELDPLDGFLQITKDLLEINQKFLGAAHERKRRVESYVYHYYVISLGALVLYSEFVQSLKDINDGWLSVKLALEQIAVKSRAGNFSYKETLQLLQQLNDLEAPQSVRFSDTFIRISCLFVGEHRTSTCGEGSHMRSWLKYQSS